MQSKSVAKVAKTVFEQERVLFWLVDGLEGSECDAPERELYAING